MATKQKLVRTTAGGSNLCTKDLQDLLEDGWHVAHITSGDSFIEYIVQKAESDTAAAWPSIPELDAERRPDTPALNAFSEPVPGDINDLKIEAIRAAWVPAPAVPESKAPQGRAAWEGGEESTQKVIARSVKSGGGK